MESQECIGESICRLREPKSFGMEVNIFEIVEVECNQVTIVEIANQIKTYVYCGNVIFYSPIKVEQTWGNKSTIHPTKIILVLHEMLFTKPKLGIHLQYKRLNGGTIESKVEL